MVCLLVLEVGFYQILEDKTMPDQQEQILCILLVKHYCYGSILDHRLEKGIEEHDQVYYRTLNFIGAKWNVKLICSQYEKSMYVF